MDSTAERNPDQIDLSKIQYSKEYLESLFKWLTYLSLAALLLRFGAGHFWNLTEWHDAPLFFLGAWVLGQGLTYGLVALVLPRFGVSTAQFNNPTFQRPRGMTAACALMLGFGLVFTVAVCMVSVR